MRGGCRLAVDAYVPQLINLGSAPTFPIAAFCLILNTDNSQESREQILFCRNKLSASYPADVILQRKQMEAIRLGTTIIDSIITFLLGRALL
jgi:hypothetical protein